MTAHPQTPGPAPRADRAKPTLPASVELLGVPLALIDYNGVLDWMDASIDAGAREYVCVAATHTVMACDEDPQLREAVRGASMTVPDGQPLVWALPGPGTRRRARRPGVRARADGASV